MEVGIIKGVAVWPEQLRDNGIDEGDRAMGTQDERIAGAGPADRIGPKGPL